MSIARLAVRSSSEGWRANQPFFVTVIAYVLLALIAAVHWRIVISLKIYNKNFLFFGAAVTLILLAIVLIGLAIQRPEQPLRAMKDLMLANNLPDRPAAGLPVALVIRYVQTGIAAMPVPKTVRS